ncbi:MAG: DEAD/DEAH box helicase [Merdibacter sp.]
MDINALGQRIAALAQLEGFKQLTPIQEQVIPLALNGKDIIGISDTGTGKTHAFLMPILERIDLNRQEVQAVITAPTRELAMQIYQRAVKMCEVEPELLIRLIAGGMEKSRMNEQLKKQPHIVIGTPGRIRDLFVNDQTLRCDTARVFVVDEADMTLEFGFLEEVDQIAGKMRSNLQMMSFSATIPNGLKPFLKKYMKAPATVQIKNDSEHQAKVEHVLVPCRHLDYPEKLLQVLKGIQPYVCLIFANTRAMASEVADLMRSEGYGVVELHGDLSSRERMKALKELQSQKKSYVVATDIAARGIDIEGITHVISLGFPKEIDFYIHRSGRTGRAGRDGICFALYRSEDDSLIRTLENRGLHFEHRNIKDGKWSELKPLHEIKQKKADPLEKEIAKIVTKKKKKVKPNYKKKQKQKIESLRRKARREMIREDIRRQQKERAKAKMRAKREEEMQ